MNADPTRRAVAAGAATLALCSLSGCGAISDLMPGTHPFLDQSPRRMAQASYDDMRDLTSMRILGDVDTRKFGRMEVDLSVGEDGCQGSLQTEGGGGFQVRENKDGTWFRVDEEFVRAQVDARQADRVWAMFRGKWLVEDGKDDFLILCDLDEILGEFELEPDDTDESLGSDDVVEVGESDTVPLTGGRGKKRTTIWVSLDSPHYVLKTAPAKDQGLPDALYFEEFGLDVVVETPPKQDVLEVPEDQSPV